MCRRFVDTSPTNARVFLAISRKRGVRVEDQQRWDRVNVEYRGGWSMVVDVNQTSLVR